MGSTFNERSVVSIVGACFLEGSCASGTVPAPAPPCGFHWCAPAGLFTNSHSKVNKFLKKLLLHFVGVVVQAPSSPLVIVFTPTPLPNVFFQPRLCSSMLAAAGSRPTYLPASAAPWVLPNV